MKRFIAFVVFAFPFMVSAQKTKQDLSKDIASTDRKEILEAIKTRLQPDLKLKPKLVVRSIWVKNGFAYFIGNAKDSRGKEINFRKTAFKDAVEAGVFDGDNTNALLKKSGSKWKVLTYAIGPSDVPWGCWWKEFKAPKEIFDYAEKTCD